MTGHHNKVLMRKLKYGENYQNITHSNWANVVEKMMLVCYVTQG